MRFGAVPYLNARPLTEGLSPLTLQEPSRLAKTFAAGKLDCALLPVAAGEALGAKRISSLGIAAQGAVDSVLLFVGETLTPPPDQMESDRSWISAKILVPPEEVQTVYLDPASRTSRALALLYLREKCGAPAQEVDDPKKAQAELVIGDRALQRRAEGEVAVDLAKAWTDWTGLPFVFAAWYGRSEARSELVSAFVRGEQRIPAYAREASEELGLPAEDLEVYLRDRIRYRLGRDELEGLGLFLDRARKAGLL